MAASLREVASYLDRTLRIAEIPDDPNAVNGLQVEAGANIVRAACAVDASEAAIEEAARRGAQLLVVHHGLFWSGLKPLVGPLAHKLATCFQRGLSVYSAHLPLDLHPELGNNAGILRALGLAAEAGFGRYQGVDVGFTARCDLSLAELVQRVEATLGPVRAFGRGPERIARLAVVSGGAGNMVGAAAREGLDALLTGEGAHYTAIDAEERGLHLLFAGHYRTETFGVKALGARLEHLFGLEFVFFGRDTGL
jgi:dinuclear metal center YbgI/SA1388 family protein